MATPEEALRRAAEHAKANREAAQAEAARIAAEREAEQQGQAK